MINPKKFIDIEDHKKDKSRIKTVVIEDLKKEYKQYQESQKIKIKFKKLEAK